MLPSGVGTQTKYIMEALLETGRYQIYSLGGAIKHDSYQPGMTEKYKQDWIIEPVDGYGSPEKIRELLTNIRPDIVYFMTDPRFYEWLWAMEDEIRQYVPMVYYHVWDNYPYPYYNERLYAGNDKIVTISKVTSDIVQTVCPQVEEEYLPHAVNLELFKKFTNANQISDVRENRKTHGMEDKFVCLWINRNARRKQSGTVLWWWKDFLDKVGHDKATLVMHTDLRDPNGQPLDFLAESLGFTKDQVQFSTNKVNLEELPSLYNLADCTINIADAEGFGLGTLESLACETPIIVNMTGGLQEQVTDGENWFGVGIEPSSKAVIGSLSVPFIHEDRVSKEDFVDALVKVYNMTPEERAELGKAGRQHVEKNYNFKKFQRRWVDVMDGVHEKYGSWDTRKNHDNRWELIKLC